MNHFLENFPVAAVVLGICILMIYPYIGAGVLLAVLCFRAGRYTLMAACVMICLALHVIMGRKIRPVKGAVGLSPAERRRKRAEEKNVQGGQDAGRE